MAFDVQTLTDAARCAECLSPNQKQNVLLYLLNGILENGSGGGGLHNLLSLTHPDTVPGPPLRGSLIVGNATPDWEALLIGANGTVLTSNGTDASWAVPVLPGGFTGFANPTALVGLVAVNGVATTAMRSDAAPALDVAIVPTWTGTHTFTASATIIGSAANALNVIQIVPPAALGANMVDLFSDGGPGYNSIRKYFSSPFQVEIASSGGIDFVIDSNNNETGQSVKFLTNALRGGVQTTLFTFLDSGVLVFSPVVAGAIQFNPFGAAAGNTSEMRYLELLANGTNYTGFKAPDSLAASEIYVLPDAAPAANRFLRAGAVAAGVSTLSWAQVSLTADVTGILPVANGGSGTSTAFTQGSVIFAGAAGVFSQDNANFFWDDTNNWLGLGIAVPLARLHVVSSAAATIATIIKAAAAQSANLTEWQSSAAVANTVINAAGNINIPTTSATVGIIFQNATRFIHSFGTNNIFVGTNSGNLTMSGTFNTGLGNQTLASVTTGNSNLAIGANAMVSNTTGATNLAIGVAALNANVDGTSNVAIGVNALLTNISGINNTAIGMQTLKVSTGSYNTAVGTNVLFTNTSGGYSTGIGYNALVTSTGGNNIGIGALAGDNITTGSGNIVIGTDVDAPSAASVNLMSIGNLIFGTGLDGYGTALSSGGVGIGVITPTARLHLRAGTTAASTSPLKFNTGTSMTTAEAGAVEFTTDDLFFTITTGAARKRLLMADATAGLTSGKMPIATTNGRLIDLTASSAYTPTNVTTDRSYDANATTLDEIADVVGTMIADLQTRGILG